MKKETAKEDENGNSELPEVIDGSLEPPLECGEEGLAIRIAVEVLVYNFWIPLL
jgi:condensin complex subunit 3